MSEVVQGCVWECECVLVYTIYVNYSSILQKRREREELERRKKDELK